MRGVRLALFAVIGLALSSPASSNGGGDYSSDLARGDAAGIAESFRRFRAYPFFDRAYSHARNGRRADAVRWLAEGLARDPGHDEARFNLILLALAENDAARARDEASLLIQRRPDFGPAYLLRGLSHIALGGAAPARADIAAALDHGGLNARHRQLAEATVRMLEHDPQQTPGHHRPAPRLLASHVLDDERFFPVHPPPPPRDARHAAIRLPVAWPDPRHVLPTAAAIPAIDDSHRLNSLAYDALADGDLDAAARYFQDSLAHRPGQSLVHQQLGYIYRAQNRHEAAASAFRDALALGGLEPVTDHALRREVASIGDRIDLAGYMVYRGRALSGPELNVLGTSLAQSQGGLEAAWRPWRDGWAAAHRPALFGRVLWGFEDNRFNINRHSAQAGIGVRFLPLPGINLVASVERLAALGREARNDWMARLSYSQGAGYQPHPVRDSWWHWHVYGDLALTDPAHPDMLGAAEGRLGRGFKIAALDGLALTPYIGVNASFEDAAGTTSLAEAGPGLWLRYWFNEGRFSAPRSAADIKLEYRFELAGDSSAASGLVLTFAVVY